MARNTDDNYVHTYQKYLKQKENYEDYRKLTPSQTASTKVLKPLIQHIDCKICKVLARPGDVCRVLHQGLYHKYTSSQDYFYTRDINSLLMKKRKEFCIRYYDDLIYDECKERLKGYFRRKETQALMHEIKQFYTKFKNFPRNFHPHFYHIINSNIRKQRRLEYIRVFNNVNLDDDRDEQDLDSQGDMSKMKEDFVFMELLGNSFLQDNYKDMSGVVVGDLRLEKRRDTEQLIKEIDTNFKALYKLPTNTVNDPTTSNLSNAVYNKNYMLYSRNDSETAEDMLRQIVNGFKDVDFSRKASMTLAEQVLQKVVPQTKNTKKPENRSSPTLKQRGTNIIESSPTHQTSKGSLGSGSFGMTASLYQLQKQQSQPLNMAKRLPSNPRTHSQADTDSTNVTGKIVNQSKISEQKKSTGKFSIENLNDLGVSREQVLSNLYQFRSTRPKSGGGTKSSLSTSKTSSSKTRRPVNQQLNTQGADSTDSRHMIPTGYYLDNKSPSPSPERKRPEAEKSSIEVISLSKAGVDSPHYNPMKRSTSNGLDLDIRDLSSPINSQIQKSAHKKSSSVVKRGSTITRSHNPNPSMQNFLNTSSAQNLSNFNTENPTSPTIKFNNPLRTTLGSPQMFYQRHQSPLEDKRGEGSGKVSLDQKMRALNIRALKSTSPKGMDNNYRMATMSMSGRHQNLSDLSQGMSSFVGNQTSLQVTKNNSQPVKRKQATKADAQIFGSKITKRASATPHQISSSLAAEEIADKERRAKRPLELSDTTNIKSYKDLRLQSKEQTPLNLCPSSATSMNKLRVEMKKSLGGSYTVKGSTKDLRLALKK